MEFIDKITNYKGAVTLLSILYLVLMCTPVYPQKTIDVDGYLVNANGKPIKNGVITPFYFPSIVTNDGLVESWKTFEDGFFSLQVSWLQNKKIMLLMEDRPPGFYPIDVGKLIGKNFFKGVVVSKFSNEKHLGKVKDYISYGQAIVDIKDSSDLFIKKVENHQIFLSIQTSDNKIVSESSFASAYSKKSKELTFQLPEGIWYLNLTDMSERKILLPYTKVVINRGKPVRVLLTK